MRQTMILMCAALALLALPSVTLAQGRGGGGGRGGAAGGGQAPAAPAQAAPSKPVEIVLIGCLERAGNNFALKDFRDGNTYQINAAADVVAPAESLAWHAGHQLEVHGMLESAGGASRLRASHIMYVSATCKK